MTPVVSEPTAPASAAPLTAAGVVEPRSLTAAVEARTEESAADLALIDASTRAPILLFFASAIGWLLLGSALAAIDTLKLNMPGFLDGVEFLTFGRVHPAATSSLVYGWAASAAIGVTLWIMARLCATRLRDGGVLTAAWALWNVGILAGVTGILYGHGTSFEGLEFPRYASPLLFIAFVIIALWLVLMVRNRSTSALYISQWYLLAALLWFPWMYSTANILLFFVPIQAPVQIVVAAWFAHGLVAAWFVPVALAAAYYIAPKVLGRPIVRYGWAKFAFWTWLVFSGLSGGYDLIGGPVPAWLLSVAVVSTLLSLLPLYASRANFSGTLEGRAGALRHSPSLRFTMTGIWCFLAAGIAAALTGFRGTNEIVHFTLLAAAQHQLLLYGFVSLALFGAMYYIIPRLLGVEWESPAMIRAHYWFSVVGAGLAIVALALGGLIQGFGLDDAKVAHIAILSFVKPFLFVQLVAVVLTGIAHVFFAASFMLILVRVGWPAMRRPAAAVADSAPPAGTAAAFTP